jgi:hypothetical protein
MASETSIINSAIRKVGAGRITSRLDGSRNANIANDLYDVVLENLLRSHNWNWAKTEAELARSGTAPILSGGFKYIYAKPADWLRTIAAYDNNAGLGRVSYQLKASGYYTSAEKFFIDYVRLETDPNQMTADFREAFAFELAMQMSTPIKAGKAIRDRLERRGGTDLVKAKGSDAIEDLPEQLPEGSWVDTRQM